MRVGSSYVLRAGDPPVSVTVKRVRNLNLRVRRDGSVCLSVPPHVSAERIQRFLDERSEWIATHRKAALDRGRDGMDAAGIPDRADGVLLRYALWGSVREAHEPVTSDQLRELYLNEVSARLPEVIPRMEAAIGAHATGWQLRLMRTRWGSCTPRTGRIRINIQLAAYPPECLDYVVAHELAHLLEASHNDRFHAIVARAIPNEREIRARLRTGPSGDRP